MKLAHFGTFDVENYGDLLFPILLERRLGPLGIEVVHVSPNGGPPVWGDCRPSISVDDALSHDLGIEGVVIGGGHIIHGNATQLAQYHRGGLSGVLAYPKLWLGAAELAAKVGGPLVWNAPGIPHGPARVAAAQLTEVAALSDYVSVRDGASAAFLRNAGVTTPVSVVPDTALELHRLWTPDELSEAYQALWQQRGLAVPTRTLSFHVKERHMQGAHAAEVGKAVRDLCQAHDATPVLIGIGPCHGDDRLVRDLEPFVGMPALFIDRPARLRDVAACIAASEAYVGSSMHGAVTALAHGRRALLVASTDVPKFAGLLEPLGLGGITTQTWSTVGPMLTKILAGPAEPFGRVAAAAQPMLDTHFESLHKALAADPERAARQRRHMANMSQISAAAADPYALYLGILCDEIARAARAERNLVQDVTHQKTSRLAGERRITALSQELTAAKARTQQLEAELAQTRRALDQEKAAVRNSAKEFRELQRAQEQLRKDEKAAAEQTLAVSRQQGAKVSGELANVRERLQQSEAIATLQRTQLKDLRRLLRQAEAQVGALLGSRQFKVAALAGKVVAEARGKGGADSPAAQLERTFEEFRKLTRDQ